MDATYKIFREIILEEAQSLSLQIHSIEYQQKDPDGEPLYTDIIHTEIDLRKPTYVHVSGCHGIEGYFGSVIQRKILQKYAIKSLSSINLIIIHAINPYGMAWYRRVNSNHVDLNRNFFPKGEFPKNLNFKTLLPLLQSRNKTQFAFRLANVLLRRGYSKVQQDLVLGQYEFPQSLFYGGTEIQDEVRKPLMYLSQLLEDVQDIKVLDVHAGLGGFGKELIFAEAVADDQKVDKFKMALKKRPEVKFMQSVYKVEGSLSTAFKHYFKGKQITYLVQEVGTVGSIPALYAMVKDHLEFNPEELNRPVAKKMLEAFFPRTEKFQVHVVNKALTTFETFMNLDA